MARSDPQVNLRMPEALKSELEAAATKNNRSLTAEIVARLEASFVPSDNELVEKFARILDERDVRMLQELNEKVIRMTRKYNEEEKS